MSDKEEILRAISKLREQLVKKEDRHQKLLRQLCATHRASSQSLLLSLVALKKLI